MAIEVDIFPKVANVESYSVSEDAIPLAPGDLSAGTGEVSISGESFTDDVFQHGSTVTLSDDRRGSVTGRVKELTTGEGSFSLSAANVLGKFDVTRTLKPPAQVVRTNLVPNPGSEGSSGTVEIRRNLAIAPSDTTHAGWGNTGFGTGGVGTDANESGTGEGGSNARKTTWTTAATAGGSSGYFGRPTNTDVAVTAGQVVSASIFCEVSQAITGVVAQLEFYDTGGVIIGAAVSGSSVNLAANVGQRLYIANQTAPTNTVRVRIIARIPNLAGTTNGFYRRVSRAILEVSPITRPYFDGGVQGTPDSDLTASWTGTANASASILTGLALTPTQAPVNCIPYQSAQWASSGTKSMRLTPSGAANDTRNLIAGSALTLVGQGVTFIAGQTYTVMAKFRQASAQTGTLWSEARKLWATTNGTGGGNTSVQATNTAGVQSLSITFTVPANATLAYVRVHNGASVGNGDVWWDDLLIVQGTYTGAYFDGSSGIGFAWTGTANASTSTKIGSFFGDVFTSWCSSVGITSVAMSDTIYNRSVAYPGWVGNVWEMVKNALTAEQLELYVVGTTVGVRNIRSTVEDIANATSLGETVSTSGLAKYVDVSYYNNTIVTQKEVYPVSGEEPTVYQVDAGAILEFDLHLKTSMLSVNQPLGVDFVQANPNYYDGSNGVYAIAGSDGLPFPIAEWNATGGSLIVSLTADPSVIHVKITASTKTDYAPYRVAMTSGEYYSALRITGSGVQFNEQTVRIATGADPAFSSDEVVAIQNPFISTISQAVNVGGNAAAQYTGVSQTITVETGDADQDFGTLPGARIIQKGANFRVTNVTSDPSSISMSAQADTTLGDMTGVWLSADTLGMMQTEWAGKTLKEMMLRPLRRVLV